MGTDERIQFDASGVPLETTRQVNDNRGPLDQWNSRAGLDYDVGAKDRLSAEIHANQTALDFHNMERLLGFGPTGAPNSTYEQTGLFKNVRDNRGGQASWRRTSGVEDDLSVSASHETTYERNEVGFTSFSLPVAAAGYFDLRSHNDLTLTDVRLDYRHPLAGEAKLKAGYDLRIDDNSYDNVATRGMNLASAAPDPTQTNLFLYRQTINSAYVTYERPFGDFTFLGGLRLEDVALNLDQVTTAIARDSNSFNAYPTLHLGYRFADAQQLTLSYSRRISRPNPADLNPFVVERDAFNFQAGNPSLKPQQTDSFEAGYQYHAQATYYLATLYYRQSSHDFTDVVADLGNGVLLSTKANLDASKHAGVELVANGHLTKTLSYNVSTNIYYAEIEAGGTRAANVIGVAGSRSAIEGGGRFSLNWQATAKDSFQASGQMNARRLTPQGYVEPSFLTFAGYRHKVSDQLALVVTVQDVFDTFRSHTVIDTPQLHDVSIGRGRIRAAYLGFAWNFGTPPKRTPPPPPPEAEPEAIHG